MNVKHARIFAQFLLKHRFNLTDKEITITAQGLTVEKGALQKRSLLMEKNQGGRIINLGSVVELAGIEHNSAYAASKGGVVGLTESLADELAPKNILVNCIAPGLIESEMTQTTLDDPKQLESLLSRIPLKRAGKPEEIASAAVFFASDESSYATGSTFVVDGGWLAS